jgi:hypothetical protein
VALLNSRRIALATILSLFGPLCSGQGNDDRIEYQVKAAFLFNFLKFVEWPPAAPASPWVIGVLGQDPFGELLEQTVRGKNVNGRTVEIRHYSRPADVKNPNILFVGRSAFERLGIQAQPGMLTVGEAPEFIKSGGIVNFYLEDNRVRFEIKPSAASSNGLRISSQLLKLGRML